MFLVDFGILLAGFLERKRSEDRKAPQKGVYYASDLGAECMRQCFYRYSVDKPVDPFTLGVFELGSVLHEWFGGVVKEALGGEVDLEKEVPPYRNHSFEVHGRADIVLRGLVVDVKTVSPNAFRHGGLPYGHHVAQVNFYMRQLGVQDAQIVYLDKYALRVESYALKFDPRLFRESMNQVRRLNSHLKDKTAPPRCAAYPSRFPCTYCNFREECKQ